MNDLSLATSQVPAHLKGKLDGVGRGNENVGSNIIKVGSSYCKKHLTKWTKTTLNM